MCTKPGLLYLLALRVCAAQSAEQSKADQECKSVAINIHSRCQQLAASTPALRMRAAVTAEQSQED